jgi:hypothetical protein
MSSFSACRISSSTWPQPILRSSSVTSAVCNWRWDGNVKIGLIEFNCLWTEWHWLFLTLEGGIFRKLINNWLSPQRLGRSPRTVHAKSAVNKVVGFLPTTSVFPYKLPFCQYSSLILGSHNKLISGCNTTGLRLTVF